MNLRIKYTEHNLNFNFVAGTSRGVMHQRKVWYVKISSTATPNVFGIGEVAPLWGLSTENQKQVENVLNSVSNKSFQTAEDLWEYILKNKIRIPASVFCGIETALLDFFNSGKKKIFDNNFYNGLVKIPINGLVWMGNHDEMKKSIQEKIDQKYTCIKIKVGAIAFENELDLIKSIRQHFSVHQITIRLDANGAWNPKEAIDKINKLSPFDIHSIEQPIRAGQIEEMRKLCKISPIPIALDEELIGVRNENDIQALLEKILPHYIILKPSLVGGFGTCDTWISTAKGLNIDWWITSALESNIGLNAICQYTANKNINGFPQGLGTGKLYHNNIDSPLQIEDGFIFYNTKKNWQSLNFDE